MNIPSKDIADLLAAQGSLSLTFATNLFVGREPTSPDNCVMVFDTPGRPPQLTLGAQADEGYYYPSIQIRVRNNSYEDGWDLVNDIKEYLHGLNSIEQGGSMYDVIRSAQEPFLLDWDENDRSRFVSTFNIQRKEV